MAISFPRINITIDNDRGTGAQGEVNILSIGFGIHQAWIYTAMFGTTSIFSAPGALGSDAASQVSLVFLISIVVFGCSLLFASITDQRFLKHYTAKWAIIVAAILTAVGTFAVFAVNLPEPFGFIATVFAGVSTGIGSALLILFWGIAFSRHGSATIVVNTAIAIVTAIAIYLFVLHVIPTPYSGVFTGCLPLLELPFLWRLTPVSYAVRHAIPIFNPLPVRKLPFSLRLALPTLLFGIALGALRSVSMQIILPSSDPNVQLLTLFAGGAATVLLLVMAFTIDKRSHWDFLFRPLIPFIAIALLFLPTLSSGDSVVVPLILVTGYMCFEAMMWIFFGEMSQEFRLSPIFIFGVGRGCLALGSLAGSLVVSDPEMFTSLTPLGEAGTAMIILLVMVIAYVLMPRVRDIKRVVIQPQIDEFAAIKTFNDQAERAGSNAAHTAEQEYDPDYSKTGQQGNGTASGQRTPQSGAYQGVGVAATEVRPASAACAPGDFVAVKTVAGEELETFEQEDQAKDTPEDLENNNRKSGRFRTQCEAIANRYLLSRRETEVMFLLARGYNAAYIQDKLFISKSTTKTHIGHIYRKLNIHNQQELLRMVAETADSPYPTESSDS